MPKTGKQLGRPRVYADPKEKFMVYNKKKPNVRLNREEKEIVLYLRKNKDRMQKLLSEIRLSQQDVFDHTIPGSEDKKQKYQEFREMYRDR